MRRTRIRTQLSTLCSPFVFLLVTSCGDQQTDSNSDETNGRQLRVTHASQEWDVSLSSLPTVEILGEHEVRLSAVVEHVLPNEPLSNMTADFLAADGFRPASSPNCESLIPLPGETLERGYIDPQTRNLSWDEELGYPGCLRINDTNLLELSSP